MRTVASSSICIPLGRSIKLMNKVLFILLAVGLILLPVSLFGQVGPMFRLKLNIGPQFRSTTHFNRNGNSGFGAVYPPGNAGNQTGGFGLNTGLELQAVRSKLSLEYSTAFRYDFLYEKQYPYGIVEGFTVDHTLSLFRYFNVQGFLEPEWKMYLGLNYTLYNLGKRLPYTDLSTGLLYKYDLTYHAWGGLLGVTFGNFGIEPKLQFIPRNVYPYEGRDRWHWLYGARMYYSIKLGRR